MYLLGRITRDPDLDQTAGETPVGRIPLAVARRRKEGVDERVVSVDAVAHGSLAGFCAHYLGKGRRMAVTGRLEPDWTAEDGSPCSHSQVIADNVEVLDSAPAEREPAEV